MPSPGDCRVGHGPVAFCLLILSPALKRWGPPSRQGLCGHPAHLWATSDFVRCKCCPLCWGHYTRRSIPPLKDFGDGKDQCFLNMWASSGSCSSSSTSSPAKRSGGSLPQLHGVRAVQGCPQEKRKRKRVRNANRNECSRGRYFMVKTWPRRRTTQTLSNNGWQLVAVGSWWRLAVGGGWRLVAVGSWWRLAVGGA